eukprot:6800170-Heterocapsa_arctica.AAC.1
MKSLMMAICASGGGGTCPSCATNAPGWSAAYSAAVAASAPHGCGRCRCGPRSCRGARARSQTCG